MNFYFSLILIQTALIAEIAWLSFEFEFQINMILINNIESGAIFCRGVR